MERAAARCSESSSGDMSLGGGNLENTLDKADAVYNALEPDQTRQVAATASASPREKPDSEKATVVTFSGKGQGKGQGKNKGKGRDKAKDKPDNGPEGCCYQHRKFGKKAYYCQNMKSCPWREHVNPPQEKEKDKSDK